MEREILKETLANLFSNMELDDSSKDYLIGMVNSEQLHSVAKKLRTDDNLHFDFLFSLCGVDYPAEDILHVVYHLRSTLHHHEFCLKAKIEGRDDPVIDTVCDIWRTAEFHERETYDFYGIEFNNHPDLRRIFLEDDWVGWPMRKDYVDLVNIVER